jgi:tRNA threonylcarbamoyl adenosine modification protein (Sua5/YciO/YrdC/YwlC family)
MLIPIHPQDPQPRHVQQAVEVLRRGGVIIYPTDTVYGLGCDINSKSAIEKIYRLKGRDKHKPLSFVCRDLSEASRYAQIDNFAYRTMNRLLPGPYTFILPATRLVPKIMLTRRHTAGIRIPESAIALALVAALGNPIITTSYTVADDDLVGDPERLHDSVGKQVDAVIDGGSLKVAPSSIIDLTGEVPEVVRAGKGDVSMFT